MNIISQKRPQQQGSVLFTVVIIGAIMCVAITATLQLSSSSLSNAHGRVAWNKAYYISEDAMVWATQSTLDNPPATGSSNYYSTLNGTLPLSKLISGGTNGDVAFRAAWVSVVQPAGSANNVYTVTASSMVDDKIRTLQASVTAFPVSQVFDYEYFLNNWGWWWGTPIYGEGGQRSNWDFDFQGGPTVDGLLYSGNRVEQNEVPYIIGTPAPFVGLAGADPITYVHDGAPRVTMPNLLNFSNYIATALSDTSSNGIWMGGTQVVAGVVNNGSTNGVSGLYLVGTSSNPIQIKGTVVVPGDLVIQGVVTGQGTFYVGGNLYLSGGVSYKNGPDFSTPPETMAPAARDAWVAGNQNKDLVAYAVNGAVFGGNVQDAGDWLPWEYWYPGSGLAYVGDESHLGADGIEGTPDDNTPFAHPPDATHSSVWYSTWYDADGNGVVNANYNYNTDINMTTARANAIQGYPTSGGNPVAYSSISTDNAGTFAGVFYTDHAFAVRSANGNTLFYGTVISRNEQIVFNNVCHFYYDSRVNSRYHNNPNDLINLGLPFGKTLAVNNMVELPPKFHWTMIRPAAHQIIGCGRSGILMLIMAMVMTTPGKAGVGLPPMPDPADTNAMAQYRVQVFYEAQKSQQEKLRVGQERYDRMLTNRAHLLQAMAAEFAARQQVVDIPSKPANEDSGKNTQPDTWLGTSIGAAAVGFCFFGYRFYLNRKGSKDEAGLKY